jgi:hypothetical protein
MSDCNISKQAIRQQYYIIMEDVFSKYKDIDERDIEQTGNILIEELVNRIMTDTIINMYDDGLVKEEFKKWKEQTLDKMKYGIKHAKKDYDEKYNRMIDRLETVILRYIKNIWKGISNCNIEKIRNELQKYNFHYKKYNFIKYECMRPDIPNAWLVYTKGVPDTYINELQNEKEDMIKMYREEYNKYYKQFTETRKNIKK